MVDGASRGVGNAEIRQQRERGVRLVLERLADVPQQPHVVDEADEGEEEQQGRRCDGRCDGGRGAPADQCSHTTTGQRNSFTATAKPSAAPAMPARSR